eukprot:scaffold7066_cov253-Pinguiococcus_pyrenoidosus.AAC.32
MMGGFIKIATFRAGLLETLTPLPRPRSKIPVHSLAWPWGASCGPQGAPFPMRGRPERVRMQCGDDGGQLARKGREGAARRRTWKA